MSAQPPFVVEATADTFQRDVLDRSREVPVVVDFWATWCAPCRTLGPVLEKLAEEYAGQFVLVKAETEALPEAATAFGVRSIPAVYGLRDGQIVDSFVGALPESSIRAWLKNVLPSEAGRLAAEAKTLEATDPTESEAKYRAAHALEPKNEAVTIALARVLAHGERPEEAAALVASLEARGPLSPEAASLKAELALRARAETGGGVEASRAAIAADPANPALRLKLAEALAASGDYAEALALGLDLVENHHKAAGDGAKAVMLNVFQLLPADSPLTAEYRRQLSAALY